MGIFNLKKICFTFIAFIIFSGFFNINADVPSANLSKTNNPYNSVQSVQKEENQENDSSDETLTLLFGGDIMAHSENHKISSYSKIWDDIRDVVQDADLAFANIESPIDTTKPVSSYPKFNMPKSYIKAAIDAGFNVFSLCNNHTNDQGLSGMKETLNTMKSLAKEAKEDKITICFSGIKDNPDKFLNCNLIDKNGWKILFLPITEILNYYDDTGYINYIKPTEESRNKLIDTIKNLKRKTKCDLFILSIHANEPEYKRIVTDEQEHFYKDLLNAGIDIIWANHTHIIKNRKVVVDTSTNSDKLIMYANGNTISGQRRNPKIYDSIPDGERDNTGDGLLYKVTLAKNNGVVEIRKAEPIFITTYINTANEFIIKKMDDNFIDYLNDVERINWAKYIERRIRINKEETKDLIEWL